jgi:acid-sensing ion channel, other
VFEVFFIAQFRVKTEANKETELLINIEFLTWPIIQYKREVLFGWVDLMVSLGGIAGLFLGFSLLSGVEIIYYFTMRAVCMLYKDKENLRQLEKRKLLRPPIRYDLDLTPKFRHRQLVEKTTAAKNSTTPTLQIISEHQILDDGQMDRLKRFRKFDASNQKLKVNWAKSFYLEF